MFDAAASAEYGPLDTFESDDELRDYLLMQYRETFDQSTSSCPMFRLLTLMPSVALIDSAFAADLVSSDTNVQVAGVDEADLVETEGQYIYSLSGDSLVIVDSWPVEELQVASRTELSGEALAMFLHGDRLTVIAEAEAGFAVMVLDVADRAAPQLISTTAIEGEYSGARLIEGKVYLHSTSHFNMAAPRRAMSGDQALVALCGNESQFETWEEYAARVSEGLVDDVLPQYQSFDAEGNLVAEGRLVSAVDVHAGYAEWLSRLTSLTVIDVAGDTVGLEHTSSVFSDWNALLYANTEQVVLSTPYANETGNIWSGYDSGLFRIDIAGDGDPVWSAAGTVPGNVLNQFSIDMEGNHLRVATTDQSDTTWLIQGGKTNLYVLAQNGDELQITGSIEDFAPGERIFSVRFMGDHAFAVTASQRVDPLFSFNLSDPANPQIIDHLEMPGMSQYLHPTGDGFLIGVGVDNADLNVVQNPRLSLFGVSDLSELSVAEHEVFTRETLEKLYEEHGAELPDTGRPSFRFAADHHAFSYDAATGILALPIEYRDRSDLLVFHIDTAEGAIETLGVIQHDAPVERSVTIDGKIYSISDQTMKIHDPAMLDEAIAALNFRVDPLDVNRDGRVAISDMLTIVLELRMQQREGEIDALRGAIHRPGLDVDSDGTLTMHDALFIATSMRNLERLPAGLRSPLNMPSDSRNLVGSQRVFALPMIGLAPATNAAIDQALLALLAENG